MVPINIRHCLSTRGWFHSVSQQCSYHLWLPERRGERREAIPPSLNIRENVYFQVCGGHPKRMPPPLRDAENRRRIVFLVMPTKYLYMALCVGKLMETVMLSCECGSNCGKQWIYKNKEVQIRPSLHPVLRIRIRKCLGLQDPVRIR